MSSFWWVVDRTPGSVTPFISLHRSSVRLKSDEVYGRHVVERHVKEHVPFPQGMTSG